MMLKLILIDDGQTSLAPVTDLLASFDLRTGALTTAQRLEIQTELKIGGLFVPDRLIGLTRYRHHLPINAVPESDEWILINGRLTSLTIPLPEEINSAILDQHGDLVMARLNKDAIDQFLQNSFHLPATVSTTTDPNVQMIRKPWQIIQQARENLTYDFEQNKLLPKFQQAPEQSITSIGDHPIRLGKQVNINPTAFLDVSAGPIVVDDKAEIGPMSVIQGPVYIGPGSVIAPHALIRANTIIGPLCKMGGEISSCVIQGYSNKNHYGFLGDSFVGEWVNLGAGTTTSNLKNTYGQISMQTDVGGHCEPTGMNFLGTIFADHVKTAIGSRLSTGCCLGTGAMLAISTMAPKYVPPFVFMTDQGTQLYHLDKFCQVADKVMRRRGSFASNDLILCLTELYKHYLNATTQD